MTVAVLLVTAGCGGDEGGGAGAGSAPRDEREAVVEATRAYQDTVLDEDADAFCDRLTGSAKQEVIATTAALGGHPRRSHPDHRSRPGQNCGRVY